jgi:signal peptidase I
MTSASGATTPSLLQRIRGLIVPQELWGYVGFIAILLVVRTFVIEGFRIPSESMEPTLLVGDWLFANKVVFGSTIPGTALRLPALREPTRGEVVLFFTPPQRDEPNPPPRLVKRLIGLPGDTLAMVRGILFLNGRVDDPAGSALGTAAGLPLDFRSPLFEWQRGYRPRNAPPAVAPQLGTWGPIIVPKDSLFVLGDNRANSKDSRFWGFVPRTALIGTPAFIYFSGSAVDGVRWSRIGHRPH